jgi:hypothetical protein
MEGLHNRSVTEWIFGRNALQEIFRFQEGNFGTRDGDLLSWELSNYVAANSAVTHLPQLKSIRSDIVELWLLLLLN